MGTATPFLEVAVLDERDQPCAVDQPGQLAVRPKLPSVILSEYLGKPEATVAAWRNLWFHTGDAAVLRSDGMYDFIDRLGDRIRVRGENLSSFQVEDLLNQHPKVQMSAAFPIPASDGDEDEVVAFVVTVEGEDVSEQDLHDHARETMPPFMRPKHLRLVPDIPRTPTNKVEKYKLRARILHELAQEDVER
jgi:crotonobetaine/carnitine-CoA ligase